MSVLHGSSPYPLADLDTDCLLLMHGQQQHLGNASLPSDSDDCFAGQAKVCHLDKAMDTNLQSLSGAMALMGCTLGKLCHIAALFATHLQSLTSYLQAYI